MPKEIAEQVAELIEPIVERMAFELVDVEYLSERGRWVLRVTADKPGGITLEDCARISREIGDVIDVNDAVQHEYVLEVSSPGLNRPLKREKDFLQVVGEEIRLRTADPIDGRRNFQGFLKELKDRTLFLQVDQKVVRLPLEIVEKANLNYRFEGMDPAQNKKNKKGAKGRG